MARKCPRYFFIYIVVVIVDHMPDWNVVGLSTNYVIQNLMIPNSLGWEQLSLKVKFLVCLLCYLIFNQCIWNTCVQS